MRIDPDEVKRRRTLAGLTQEELAHIADLSTRTVWSIEAGENPLPRVGVLRKLAATLGVEIADITRDDEDGAA